MNNSGLTVRLAGAGDIETVTTLFHAIDIHYFGDEAPPRNAVRRHVGERVLAAERGCEVAVAERGGAAVDITTFVVVYPAPGLSGQLYMKDLFVMPEARGSNVGRSILQWLAAVARSRGCSRLDWTAERDNPQALAFYDGLDVPRVEDKVYLRLDGDALERFASAGGASEGAG